MSTVKFPFYARLALTLLAIVLVFFILRVGDNIFVPLVFALLISILLFPVNRFFENKLHLGRVASAIISVLLFVAALVSFIYFLTLQIIHFSGDFPQLRQRFQQMFDSLQHWLSYKLHINNRQQTDYINRSVNGILESIAHSLSNVFVSVTGVLVLTIFVLIFTFFMLYHRRLLMRFVLHLFNVQYRPKVNEVIIETKSMIYSYVLGLMIEMIVISFVNCTMFLIMGIQYALLLGVMAAVLNIIPYLGIYTSIVICMLVTFANSTGNAALVVGLGLFIVHVLDANILFPRIVGGRVKMNPFITIIAVIVGELLWGVPGMFLFIPIIGIIKLVCERVEGLEAWGLLIGVEEVEKKPARKVRKDG
ncbi:MAG: AI-2E family transporter [Chitinophagales bacterium]